MLALLQAAGEDWVSGDDLAAAGVAAGAGLEAMRRLRELRDRYPIETRSAGVGQRHQYRLRPVDKAQLTLWEDMAG